MATKQDSARRAGHWRTAWPLLLLALLACEPTRTVFTGPYYVRFTADSLGVRESQSAPLRVEVHNVGPQLTQPIVITYTIGGSAREGVDYRIVEPRGTVTIPANQSKGAIVVQLINNANDRLLSQNVVFTMQSVTPPTLGLGTSRDGIIGRRLTLTIFDDCILTGTYSGNQTDPRNQGAPDPNVTIVSTSPTVCGEYLLSNWDIGITNALLPPRRALRFTYNGDNSLTIPLQQDPTLRPNNRNVISGNGSVNPANRQIVLNVRTLNADSTVRTTQLRYVPQ